MPAAYTLKGKVKDAALGTPIPNALVKIVSAAGPNFGKSDVTNASGKYKITGVLPGKIILEAAICYKPKGQMLTVSANKTVDFALSKL